MNWQRNTSQSGVPMHLSVTSYTELWFSYELTEKHFTMRCHQLHWTVIQLWTDRETLHNQVSPVTLNCDSVMNWQRNTSQWGVTSYIELWFSYELTEKHFTIRCLQLHWTVIQLWNDREILTIRCLQLHWAVIQLWNDRETLHNQVSPVTLSCDSVMKWQRNTSQSGVTRYTELWFSYEMTEKPVTLIYPHWLTGRETQCYLQCYLMLPTMLPTLCWTWRSLRFDETINNWKGKQIFKVFKVQMVSCLTNRRHWWQRDRSAGCIFWTTCSLHLHNLQWLNKTTTLRTRLR